MFPFPLLRKFFLDILIETLTFLLSGRVLDRAFSRAGPFFLSAIRLPGIYPLSPEPISVAQRAGSGLLPEGFLVLGGR